MKAAAFVFTLVLLTLASRAATADQAAEADALFRRAVQELDAGHLDVACPMLEKSYRLDPKTGTLFTLAECHAKQAKTPKALREYKYYMRLVDEMPADKKQRHLERYNVAKEEVEKLSMQIGEGAEPTVEKSREAPRADVGERAKAKNDGNGSWSGSRKIAFATATVVGVAGLLVGGITGGIAASRAEDIKKNCTGRICTGDASSLDARKEMLEETQALAMISTIALPLGIVAAATGVILGVTSEKKAESAAPNVRVSVIGFAGRGAMVGLEGNF